LAVALNSGEEKFAAKRPYLGQLAPKLDEGGARLMVR
jgi:hypothetical protein